MTRRDALQVLGAGALGLAVGASSPQPAHAAPAEARPLEEAARNIQMLDAIVIGGGPGGLSAALLLGRAGRNVLVCDGGSFRNARAPVSHSFLTRDGTPPLELLRLAREQLRPYRTVRYERAQVLGAAQQGEGLGSFFEVQVRRGNKAESVRARKVLLATGVRDELPDVPGLADCWGLSAFACPYCHGHEVRGEPLALLVSGEAALEVATLLSGWSRDLALCSNGPLGLPNDKRAWLARHRVQVREERIARVEHRGGQMQAIVFESGDRLPRRAAFLRPRAVLKGADLIAALGCRLTERGLVEVDAFGRTSAPGVHAAGDAIAPLSISHAVNAGAVAAGSLNAALIKENLEREDAALSLADFSDRL